MGRECRYSFDDLFRLANDRDWTAAEKSEFLALDHSVRNAVVKRLAQKAGNVQTEDRLGTDGQVYTAFWVKSPG